MRCQYVRFNSRSDMNTLVYIPRCTVTDLWYGDDRIAVAYLDISTTSCIHDDVDCKHCRHYRPIIHVLLTDEELLMVELLDL